MDITYDGKLLTRRFVAQDVERPIPPMAVRVESLDVADGSFPRGANLDPSNITLRLVATNVRGDARRTAERELAALLDAREPRKLVFSDDGGLYYMAQPSGSRVAEILPDAVSIAVEFYLPDPVMYGSTKTASLSTGASSITVGGTYPARCKVTSSNATKSSSNLWGVRLDNGKYMRVPHELGSAVNVTVDTEKRTARVNGSTSMITLDSDWLELSPGSHSVKIDQGGGAATLQWTERWL